MRLRFWRSAPDDEVIPPPPVDSPYPAPRREQIVVRGDDTDRTERRLAAEPDADTVALPIIADDPGTASAGSDPRSAEAVLPRIRAQEPRRSVPSHRRNTSFPIPLGEHHRDPVLAPPPRREDDDSTPGIIPSKETHPADAAPRLTTTAAPAGSNSEKDEHMSKIESSIGDLLAIDGASGAAIVDISTGMELGSGGTPGFDLTVAAAGNSDVIRAKLATMSELGLDDNIEDIMITLESQYHLINVLNTTDTDGLFIYLVLDRKKANLALARHKLKLISASVSV